jgi:cellulose synthase/poly-beta-1,6-N-acetylglucosamine synthase-like glycosyltransferase
MSTRISIVVPAHNAENTIARCIESVLNLDFPREQREILIVDNSSNDRTKEIIRRYPVTYVFEPQRGVGAARNRGIHAASGEIIAFTDADCIVSPDWLQHISEAFEDPEVIACGGKVEPLDADTIVERYTVFRRILDQEKMLEANRRFSPPFAITANAAFRRSALLQVGAFDPQIKLTADDADLSWRLQWAGFKIRYVPDAIVFHKHRTNLAGLFRQCFRYGYGNAQLFAKHRRQFGKQFWIDPNPYVWLIKALLKTPYSLIVESNALQRYLPALDTVSNAALIVGKIYGSMKHRCLVL